ASTLCQTGIEVCLEKVWELGRGIMPDDALGKQACVRARLVEWERVAADRIGGLWTEELPCTPHGEVQGLEAALTHISHCPSHPQLLCTDHHVSFQASPCRLTPSRYHPYTSGLRNTHRSVETWVCIPSGVI